MSAITPDRFAEFYTAVHGYAPFPWQERVAARVCGGDWPRAIALPTAAGKTACIDVAVFALACAPNERRQPRRVFFVVDRRIVVDQAFEHARKLAKVLRAANDGILKQVADALRALTGEPADDARPLDVYALRGGMYRETAWAKSPLQPTVIASTVDQVGSRLLFRGYGVSDSMKPVHAGLVGNDALVLLDEAHCAKPFEQTMRAVERYRAWGEPNPSPFTFVSVTATPTDAVPEDRIERDNGDDCAHAVLGARISASKPAKLVVAEKAKGKTFKQWGKPLVDELEGHAKALVSEGGCVGVIVNRVATARALAARLGADAVLLTGRMRPLDRDRVFAERLQPLLSGADGTPPKFVIGTQCLECGADFDFHALVTECASLDALRQRFGRLNRIAKRATAEAVIVIRADQTDDTTDDPIYGASLGETWKWLGTNATDGTFDFGVSAVRTKLEGVSREQLEALNALAPSAPVLFPTHLDCWAQTHPTPVPDPDPALFLHGPKEAGQPDVQVVFRADLGEKTEQWAEIVALCPPSSSEAVAVPIGVFKRWLAGEDVGTDETGDVEGAAEEQLNPDGEADPRPALWWCGPEKSELARTAADVRPNQTYVVPCSAPQARALADFPAEPTDIHDYAGEAFQRSRDKALLRLEGVRFPEAATPADEAEHVLEAIRSLAESSSVTEWQARAAKWFLDSANAKRRDVAPHPLGGVVVTGTRRLMQFDPTHLDDSEPGESFRGRAVTLHEHSLGVAGRAKAFARALDLGPALFEQAGLWHDIGKLDPRFQAMLRQSSPRTAVGAPLAKSAKQPRTREEADELREVHRYPRGARHELLSVAVVESKCAAAGADDLLLHLIATHHGSARPFALPVEENDTATEFAPKLFDTPFPRVSVKQDVTGWNAELPERFWRVVRKFGWWGAAYREAVFRLADHAQSAAEQERDAPNPPPAEPKWVPPAGAPRREWHELPLPGLDGANPLAFLAALGTLRVADREFGGARLSWKVCGHWVPVLHLPRETEPAELVTALMAHDARTRRCFTFAEDLKIPHEEYTAFQHEAAKGCESDPEFAQFLAAYANPLVTVQAGPNAGKTKPSEFYFIAGRQQFLAQVRKIAAETKPEHITKCLFEVWRYDDPLEGLSLRWDPLDDSRYATRWRNPSGDPERKKRGSVLGANRLAVEALALFPCFARGTRLATTGFVPIARSPFFVWPLWTAARSSDAVRSLLAQLEAPKDGKPLALPEQLGTGAWYACEKVPNSDYSNFAPPRVV